MYGSPTQELHVETAPYPGLSDNTCARVREEARDPLSGMPGDCCDHWWRMDDLGCQQEDPVS